MGGVDYRIPKTLWTDGQSLLIDGEEFPFATARDTLGITVAAPGVYLVNISFYVDGTVQMVQKDNN